MALIAVYGMYATGKTTFCKDFMDTWADYQSGLVVVLADLAEEYHFNSYDDAWELVYKKDIYKGAKEDGKIGHLLRMISDTERIWIVESARFFMGLQDVILSGFSCSKGGVRFLIPWCEPAVGKQFLIDRCDKYGKEFNEPYWTDKRLQYECSSRYKNVMDRYYEPAGVDVRYVEIEPDHVGWGKANIIIKDWLQLPGGEWYDSLPSKGN